MVNNSGTGRFSKNFRDLIEKIKAMEKERTGIYPSDKIATEIIYQKIIKVGGLKEY